MQKLQSSVVVGREAPAQHETILAQIQALDRQNKKLVAIADNILKTSFLRPVDQKPTIILQFQQDMRASFNALIESIREFFISIDQKMEQLATIVQANCQVPDLERSKYLPRRQQPNDTDKIEVLVSRMNVLEQNLKKTQQNQSRLISIIENMAAKRNLYDQQPTMVRSRDNGFTMPTQYAPTQPHQTSFRLFSVHGTSANSLQTDHYGSPPAPYLVTSQASDKQKQLDRQPTYRFSNFCMPVRQQSKAEPLLMRKGQMENSNRIHRLSTLMKALKE